jgi:hypothetical protein
VNFQSGGERFSFSRQVAPKSDEGGWGEGRMIEVVKTLPSSLRDGFILDG